MCGKDTQLFKTDIEGSILNVCKQCSKFGKVISVIREKPKETKKETKGNTVKSTEPDKELVLAVIPNYGEIIKKQREILGIKQEDFAKRINEKVSLVHKIETNNFEPNVSLARKIEKFLHIKLLEIDEVKPTFLQQTKSEGFTIGDFIKVKK